MPKGTCSIDDCERPVRGRGWCQRHYMRWYKYGDPLVLKRSERGLYDGCSVPDCGLPHHGHGFCSKHAARKDPFAEVNRGTAEVSYSAAHCRALALFGPARSHVCPCGGRAAEWAYTHDCPGEKSENRPGDRRGNRYDVPYCTCLQADHYRAMCVSCHRAYDRQRISQRDHPDRNGRDEPATGASYA